MWAYVWLSRASGSKLYVDYLIQSHEGVGRPVSILQMRRLRHMGHESWRDIGTQAVTLERYSWWRLL